MVFSQYCLFEMLLAALGGTKAFLQTANSEGDDIPLQTGAAANN